jgi:hypothetical protein
MELKDRILRQVQDALGPVNRWYCSEYHGYEVTDAEQLLEYYIKHGGAERFAKACQVSGDSVHRSVRRLES